MGIVTPIEISGRYDPRKLSDQRYGAALFGKELPQEEETVPSGARGNNDESEPRCVRTQMSIEVPGLRTRNPYQAHEIVRGFTTRRS